MSTPTDPAAERSPSMLHEVSSPTGHGWTWREGMDGTAVAAGTLAVAAVVLVAARVLRRGA